MAELVAVRHHDREPVELELGDLLQARAKLRRVCVAVDGRNGRDRLELDEDLGLADVAGVEDVVDLLKHLEHLRPQKTVRIRDDAQSHFPSQRFTRLMSSPS